MKYDINYIKKLWFANRNHISGRYYMGITNQQKLKDAGFTTPERLTRNQAKKNGYKVKAWAKWVRIQHKEFVKLEEKSPDGKVEVKEIPQVKSRLLFNIEQTEPVKVR